MNRRALLKSIVASVCIGTAQQLGFKPIEQRIPRITTLEELSKNLQLAAQKAWMDRHGKLYYTLTRINPYERA